MTLMATYIHMLGRRPPPRAVQAIIQGPPVQMPPTDTQHCMELSQANVLTECRYHVLCIVGVNIWASLTLKSGPSVIGVAGALEHCDALHHCCSLRCRASQVGRAHLATIQRVSERVW